MKVSAPLLVVRELNSARKKFPDFNSAHEAFAVLKEEVDELWDEVKGKQGKRDLDRMEREATQIAAMAIRFIEDITRKGKR